MLDSELSQALSAAEDPVAELNLMVSTWLDPEANSASFEAGSVSLLDELKVAALWPCAR